MSENNFCLGIVLNLNGLCNGKYDLNMDGFVFIVEINDIEVVIVLFEL